MTFKTIEDAIKHKIRIYGGVRAMSRKLNISPGYISKMSRGYKSEPGEDILEKLGLVRVVEYREKTDETRGG